MWPRLIVPKPSHTKAIINLPYMSIFTYVNTTGVLNTLKQGLRSTQTHSNVNSAQTQSNKTKNIDRKGQHVGDEPFMLWDKGPAEAERRPERARAQLQAKSCMFDSTKRYFQNRIQKFQPSGHNYHFSKLRFRSFAILPASCDTDTQGGWEWGGDVLAGGEVGAQREGPQINQTGRKAGSQVASRATV